MPIPLKFYYQDIKNGIFIIQGDSVDVLPRLKQEFPTGFDGVVTDPPYNLNYRSNYTKKDSIMGRLVENDDSFEVIEKTTPLIYDLLKDNTAAYFFASSDKIGDVRKIIDSVFQYRSTIAWDKGDQGTMGNLRHAYSKNWEAILYYNKGKRILNGSRPRAIYRWNWAAKNDPVHSNSKPVILLEWLLKNSSNEGDFILDPFMGTGPVGKACKNLGRRYLGITLDKSDCNRAVERIDS